MRFRGSWAATTIGSVGLSFVLVACSGGAAQAPGTVTVTVNPPAASAGASSGAKPTASSTAKPTTTATTPPAPKTFALGLGSFGGLKLPATPAAVLAAAKPLLGDPTKKVEGPGCELAGPGRTSILLKWGDISAYGEAGPGEALKIDSWSVVGKATLVPVALPFGTSIGMSRTLLAKALTSETVDDSHMFAEGDILMQNDTWWSLNKANTSVVTISHKPHVCE
ncbi:MAG: hypothetical protein IPF90_01055 [Actinomycetales bacterium]|nr:hypothetical protein [Candidatus Phosphoribacter baldrii]